jgi:preprotein translocase subunit SecY
MKKFIETLRNIWKIEDLRARIMYTLGIILIYRLGTHIVLPGIDPVMIAEMAKNRQQRGTGILDLLNLCSQGVPLPGLPSLDWGSCLTSLHPSWFSCWVLLFLISRELQREGESGRRKINQITVT